MKEPIVIVICGPTASGKTTLSIALAKQINGEILSADSMQIYQDMNIGTAKVTQEETQGIPHYMVDIIKPNQRYSVAEFKKQAEEKIEDIIKRNKIPIIVGGTGLYINSLIYNIQYPEIPVDMGYRKQLEKQAETEGIESLYQKAYQIDPEATKKIGRKDKKRIIRILEMYQQTGKTKTQIEIESKKQKPKYHYHVYGIDMPREQLYARIDKRVDYMIEKGLVEEVKAILAKYQEFPTAMQGLGYKEVVCYLQGNTTKDDMIRQIKKDTRHYAKRQMTWFKAIDNMVWLEANKGIPNAIKIILEDMLSEPRENESK